MNLLFGIDLIKTKCYNTLFNGAQKMVHPSNYALTSGSWYSSQPYNKFTCIWQAAESYLDVGQQSYKVSDLEKLELRKDNYSFDTAGDILLRIAKVVSYVLLFPVALGALCIRSHYRAKWRIADHFKAYPNLTSFSLTPPGNPICSLAQLQANKKQAHIEAPQPSPAAKPPFAFVDSYSEFLNPPQPAHPIQPAQQSAFSPINLGTQYAGNDTVRVLQRNPDCDYLENRSIVTDEDGYSYLYIRGNNDRDILIRK